MKVNRPWRWWLIEQCSFWQCWTHEKLERWVRDPSEVFVRWLVCWVTHRGYWKRSPVHHSWDFWCRKCNRRWTKYD